MSELPIKDGCNFCRGNNLLKDRILCESTNAYVIEPNTRNGNYLLIPDGHYEALTDLSDGWWEDIKSLLSSLPELGDCNLSINIGEQAGQKMKHLHFWVIPRQANTPSSGKGMAALIAAVDGGD